MIGRPYKLNVWFYTLLSSLVIYGAGILCVTSSAEAQSNKEVRVAVDQLRATLITATAQLRATLISDTGKLSASQKSTTVHLKTDLVNSLNQLLSALTEMNTALSAIQNTQERRVDNNQLYCSMVPFTGNPGPANYI